MAYRKGHEPPKKGRGKAYLFLLKQIGLEDGPCLIWPFSTNGTGYGRLGVDGKGYYAHRYMCELVNGPPPTPDHEASHDCGNGHLGCVHPRHLEWKTASENHLDRRRHGTHV